MQIMFTYRHRLKSIFERFSSKLSCQELNLLLWETSANNCIITASEQSSVQNFQRTRTVHCNQRTQSFFAEDSEKLLIEASVLHIDTSFYHLDRVGLRLFRHIYRLSEHYVAMTASTGFLIKATVHSCVTLLSTFFLPSPSFIWQSRNSFLFFLLTPLFRCLCPV